MTEAATTDGMPASERSSGRKRATADYGTRVIDDLTGVAEGRWQALVEASGCGGPHGSSGAVAAAPLADDEDDPAVGGLPFIDWRYLTALEQTGCVGGRSGWAANHLLVERNGELVAAAPLYRKLHSYGEYVFDWAWADAYQRHGLDYYPKGLVASPFTPVPGPRLLAVDDVARDRLLAALVDHAREQQWSSLHLLFPPRAEAGAARRAGWLERRGVQFHWRNPGYRDFDDFLSRLAQPKRKKILAERRKVREAGIRISCHEGPTISAPHWLLFNRCYRTTYALHHSTPYLNRAFFERIGRTMPEHLVMFIAHDESNGEPVAASLLVHDEQAIYGRYWGALRWVPCLHFEASYYAPIEWAIARKIGRFEGGAQGEHKMARGFLPVRTRSLHWLAHPAFADAVAAFLERERGGVDDYLDELDERNPMRDAAAVRTSASC